MSAYNLEKDLCRCCHAEGSFLNLAEPVYHLGKKELYCEMLRNTLHIDILQTAGELHKKTYKICEQCVLRLRDANDFKLQVTSCEQRFKEMCHNFNLLAHTTIKVEIEQPPETSQQDSEPNLCPVVDLNIKMEPQEPKHDPEDYDMDSDTDDNGTPPSTELTLKKSTEEIITGDLDTPSSSKKTVNSVTNKNIKGNKAKNDNKTKSSIKNNELLVEKPNESETNLEYKQYNYSNCFKCNLCRYTAITKTSLKTHLKLHSAKKKYVCDICSYTSVLKKSFNNHLRRHTGEKPFTCDVCPRKFSLRSGLRRHVLVHDKKIYPCDLCDKVFGHNSELNRHKKYHELFNYPK